MSLLVKCAYAYIKLNLFVNLIKMGLKAPFLYN